MSSELRDLVATLRTLHDRLADALVDLSPEQLRSGSYDSDWTVAQVVSHLGSGAELTLLSLDADRSRPDAEDGPSPEETAAVWATWDARTPEQQVVEGIATDERLVTRLEQLDDGDLEIMRHDLGGIELDAASMLRLRLAEHAMHSWDVAVTFDDAATVPPEGVAPMLDLLPVTLRFAAQPHDEDCQVDVRLTDPDRTLGLELRHGETRVVDASGEPALELPAEAFLRLVYGRLDPRHAPEVQAADETLLPRLRGIFRGF